MPVPDRPGWWWWKPPADASNKWQGVFPSQWTCLEVRRPPNNGHLYVTLWLGEVWNCDYEPEDIGGQWGPRIEEPEEKP